MRGGEDIVFEQEHSLLAKDNTVEIHTAENARGLKGAIQFLLSIWNPFAIYRLKKKIDTFQPEIVHIHNFHFALGPAIIRTIKKYKIPIIITLHNYRLICPSATLMNQGKLFTDSMDQSFPWSAVKHKVYRNSFIKTFWLAFIFWSHRKIGTWQMVDRYVLLTASAREHFQKSMIRFKEMQLVVKPNFVSPAPEFTDAERSGFLFVGRLVEEKGIPVLLQSFAGTQHQLNIIGDGHLADIVKEAAKQNPNIRYLGLISRDQVMDYMRKCSALVVPSIWPEPFGLVIIEAFSLGTPVIASNIGAPASLIVNNQNGLHFLPGNSTDLSDKLELWESFPEQTKQSFCLCALKAYNEHYSPVQNKKSLLNIYHKAIHSHYHNCKK